MHILLESVDGGCRAVGIADAMNNGCRAIGIHSITNNRCRAVGIMWCTTKGHLQYAHFIEIRGWWVSSGRDP